MDSSNSTDEIITSSPGHDLFSGPRGRSALTLNTVSAKQFRAAFLASFLMLALVVASFVIGGNASAHWMNLTIVVFGSALGWVIGTFISPSNDKERERFGDYAKAASVFISGYFIGKFDKLADHLFSNSFLAEETTTFRVIVWLASVIISGMFVFCLRAYGYEAARITQ